MYSRYNPEGNLDKDEIQQINHKIRDLFTSKIGFVVVDSADTIVISAFLGLTALAIYQNYFYILSSVMGFIAVVFTSCTAGIGNSIIVETAEKNYNDLKKFTFLISWISGMCLCCFLNLYQPFMELWVGKDLMLSMGAVVCFCVYFYIQEINKLFNTYKDASGIWHEDRFRPLVVALTNLCLNLLMVNFWGIYGILLSTVFATLFVGMPWLLHNLFTTVFDKKYLSGFLINLGRYVAGVALVGVITYLICNRISFSNLWLTLVIRGLISCLIPNVVFWGLYHRLREFKECVKLVDKMTKGKFRLKDYENLYCIDVVCHGVPSPKLWRHYLEHMETINNAKIIGVNFRCKDQGWKNFGMEEIQHDKKKVYIPSSQDSFMRMFLRNYCLRPSCYECEAKLVRCADLTLADFWGINFVAPEMNDNKGVSLVIIRSQRGQSLFDTIQEKLCYKKVDYNAAIKYNPSEITSAPRPKERNKFFTDLEKKEFIKMEKKYAGDAKIPLKQKLKNILRKALLRKNNGGGTVM